MYIAIFFAGFGGGMVRGLIGFIKHQYSYKEVKFSLPYFFSMVFLSGIIGVLCGAAIKELSLSFLGSPALTPAMAFVIGYAGGDFIDGISKIVLKKNTEAKG